MRDPAGNPTYGANPVPPSRSTTVDPADAAPLTIECPRCRTEVSQSFYGPCASCISELHARFDGTARDVGSAEYVPKINVVPNAVATKE